MLIPGDSVTLNFTVRVDRTSARDLASGRDTIDDILVLRLENGPCADAVRAAQGVGDLLRFHQCLSCTCNLGRRARLLRER